jgi:hypothetical protein
VFAEQNYPFPWLFLFLSKKICIKTEVLNNYRFLQSSHKNYLFQFQTVLSFLFFTQTNREKNKENYGEKSQDKTENKLTGKKQKGDERKYWIKKIRLFSVHLQKA